ncbi:transcriptional regulator [Haloarculaceae archaeon H-GB2-1]|nr:transcriptional regulator [Haloarculaceae archaeon H-GB1-1]MEA5407126.1 transcriptional regulator [Haloarculaceae archaeon H-GB2-1]
MEARAISGTLDVLSKPERRCILYYLREHESASLEKLVDLVTGWLHAMTGDTAGPGDDQRIRTSLHHVHLPVLVDRGILTYDEANGNVELESLSTFTDRILDVTLDAETELPTEIREQVTSAEQE